jgi:hypothetical protein
LTVINDSFDCTSGTIIAPDFAGNDFTLIDKWDPELETITLPSATSNNNCGCFVYSLVPDENPFPDFIYFVDPRLPNISVKRSKSNRNTALYYFKVSVTAYWHETPVLSEVYTINLY